MPFFRLGPTTRLDDTKIMAICQRGKIVGEGTPSWLVRACRRGLDHTQNATHALCSDGHKVIIITIVILLPSSYYFSLFFASRISFSFLRPLQSLSLKINLQSINRKERFI